MGLEASIEKVFRRAMESDLELIAQNVSADTSSNTTPQGSCMCACNISATVVRSNRERPEEQLYSVERIVFRPVENFAELMDTRIEEANDREAGGPHLDTLGTLLAQGPSMLGPARILVQNKVLSLIGVMARHYQEEGPNVAIVVRAKGNVITIGVMDYFLDTLTRNEITKLIQTNELRITTIPSLERWPEAITIGELGYRRADLALSGGDTSGPPPIETSASGRPRVHKPWTLQQVLDESRGRQKKNEEKTERPHVVPKNRMAGMDSGPDSKKRKGTTRAARKNP